MLAVSRLFVTADLFLCGDRIGYYFCSFVINGKQYFVCYGK